MRTSLSCFMQEQPCTDASTPTGDCLCPSCSFLLLVLHPVEQRRQISCKNVLKLQHWLLALMRTASFPACPVSVRPCVYSLSTACLLYDHCPGLLSILPLLVHCQSAVCLLPWSSACSHNGVHGIFIANIQVKPNNGRLVHFVSNLCATQYRC